jgi:MarR family transcriptional regulator for hemolysin
MTKSRTFDERTFTGSLLRLARIYRREVNRALAEHGLSDAKALPVLHIARAGGGLRQGVLAEELGVEGPSWSASSTSCARPIWSSAVTIPTIAGPRPCT